MAAANLACAIGHASTSSRCSTRRLLWLPLCVVIWMTPARGSRIPQKRGNRSLHAAVGVCLKPSNASRGGPGAAAAAPGGRLKLQAPPSAVVELRSLSTRTPKSEQSRSDLFTKFCHATFPVRELHMRGHGCPANCPYVAQVTQYHKHLNCLFKCVPPEDCGTAVLDKKAAIADPKVKHCRRCYVAGCRKCSNEHIDKCLPGNCDIGYYEYEGRCVSEGKDVLSVVFKVLGVIFVILLFWWIDLMFIRPTTNQEGLEHGLRFRQQTKLHQGVDEETGEHIPYSWLTNFHSFRNSVIAGSGTVLHFNYLLFSAIWPAIAGIAWYTAASMEGHGFLGVGTEPDETPAQLCAATYGERALADEFHQTTLHFVAFVYGFSFIFCVGFTTFQRLAFHAMKGEESMEVCIASVTGLPPQFGDSEAETEAKAFLEIATKQVIVGVSLCWSYGQNAEQVMNFIENDLRIAEFVDNLDAQGLQEEMYKDDVDMSVRASESLPLDTLQRRRAHRCFLHRWMSRCEDGLLKRYVGYYQESQVGETIDDARVLEFLQGLQTTPRAFVVFRSKAMRDAAVRACAEADGFEHPAGRDGKRVFLQPMFTEPSNIVWKSFDVTAPHFKWRMAKGALTIFSTQVAWGVLFYLPYVYYMAAFSYAHGEEPDMSAKYLFSMIVVLGNQVNYFVCGAVAFAIGFHFTDHEQAFYTVTYSCANLLNVVVDILVTGGLSYRILTGVGAHNVDGVPLKEMDEMYEIIDSFPMQKTLGAQLMLYNFPSTFVLPYILEPIFAIVFPLHIMKLLVRRCTLIVGRRAEVALEVFIPMDLGRYADVAVNLTLCFLAWFFAQGFWMQTFVTCAAGNIWIYILDRYRVVQCVPSFRIGDDLNDRFAQGMLALPCGIMAAAVVWKHAERDVFISLKVLAACVAHIIVHLWLIYWVLPRLVPRPAEESDLQFADVAARTPCSPFTTNPVHCLRSKYFYKHDPPCVYHCQGKEFLLKENPEIGCYFRGRGCKPTEKT